MYKDIGSVDKHAPETSRTFSPSTLELMHWIEKHPEVQTVLNDYHKHREEFLRLDEETLRIDRHGNIGTHEQLEQRELAEQVREGLNIVTSNLFGGYGMWLAQHYYPDDREMQNKYAHTFASLGEILHATGEVAEERHEWSHYPHSEPGLPLYAPGKHEPHHTKPSDGLAPGEKTYNKFEHGESPHRVGDTKDHKHDWDNSHHQTKHDPADPGPQPGPPPIAHPHFAHDQAGKELDQAMEHTPSLQFDPAGQHAGTHDQPHSDVNCGQDANYTTAQGGQVHMAPLEPAAHSPGAHDQSHGGGYCGQDANYTTARGEQIHIAPLEPTAQPPGAHDQPHGHCGPEANFTTAGGQEIHVDKPDTAAHSKDVHDQPHGGTDSAHSQVEDHHN
jgi:hypothetical protein